MGAYLDTPNKTK
jgi:protein phosphatase 2C family protein 2/3